ncbi:MULTISPECIES: hypothetical protein [Moorena]|uniref:hypothetical protein n=1 Tax=Moorena TaxID=1155738 RepID=UPI00030C7114|nr:MULTISPECIES: hypothetical protein [Moorena]NEP32306.1 hypothetical protein [Moorena sp. SIO3B2]NEP70325.1 hypothetical protein [Moorena sp. SIO3A5]NER89037.1 hypothetical protein [Moorena sp. SIO3A2]
MFPDSLLPTPDSRFPIPDSRFPNTQTELQTAINTAKYYISQGERREIRHP